MHDAGSGKTTLLRALAAKSGDLKVQGNITYNGHNFNEFFVPRTAAYVDQTDNHTAQLTVRETFDFATRVQGVGSKASAFLPLLLLQKVVESPASIVGVSGYCNIRCLPAGVSCVRRAEAFDPSPALQGL